MPISLSEKEKEQEYLDIVMRALLARIDEAKASLESKKSEVIELNKTMMEDIGNDVGSLGKFVDAYSYLTEIGSRAGVMRNSELEFSRLDAMRNSPYFARMDFSAGGSTMKVYIGTGSLMNPETLDFYVFDWRSPIAGMYYDFETGAAEYVSPGGVVKGEITKKRQFKIWKGEILAAYDTSVAIGDEMLFDALSKSADSKMQSIVCTIQREQNRIIRNKSARCLVAFGPAGSGKTSVAMQRAAFFLYAYCDEITSSNIMIFSPNSVFGDYISDVLPLLGEENVKSVTLSDFANSLFEGRYNFGSASSLLEFAVEPSGIRERSARLKLSETLRRALTERIEFLTGNAPHFPDMVYDGKVIMSSEEMTKLYTKDFSYLSIQGRLNKLCLRVSVFAKDAYKKKMARAAQELDMEEDGADERLVRLRWNIREEHKAFMHYAERTLSADPEVIYLDVLEKLDKDVWRYTKENLAASSPEAEDAAPLLYLLSSTREIKNEIRFLIVDEAQDYTPLAFDAIKNCFKKASVTILGDTNQAVNPLSGLVTAEEIAKIFPGSEIVKLEKSYRNTAQISEFCSRILGIENSNYMKRDGEKVTMSRLHTEEDYYKALILESVRLREKGMTSAVIFPTQRECDSLYEKYGRASGLGLVTGGDREFKAGNVIIPAYMAKGLEFDAVLLPYKSYEREELKHVLYTASTRALHILRLFRY